MSGFRSKPRVRKLVFDDDSVFPGLVLLTHGVTLGEWSKVEISQLGELFADRLVEWNWEDEDGNVLPPTLESVQSLDASDGRTLCSEWINRVADLQRPLDTQNGQAVAERIEEAIPMEQLPADD